MRDSIELQSRRKQSNNPCMILNLNQRRSIFLWSSSHIRIGMLRLILQKKDDGDWWLYFGHDGQNLAPVGFWPKNIFTSLADHANIITWGGYTGSFSGDSSPPMGNGKWPGANSATYQDVQYVSGDGQGYAPPPWPGGVHADVTHKNCYQLSPFTNNMFYYGGPGGCSD